ncbi:uncharacterized protein [Palaemon carinicauda]|uniref:uncharacterized protein n=1 Tax=Palaemon carinicauda TaxID=392227 RepID=UPI0035B65078
MTQNCSLCDKVFVTKEALDEHLLNHEKKKTRRKRGRPGNIIPCICSECDEVFYRRCDLRLHKRMVHQPKKVMCSVCGRKFSSEGRLKMHFQFHNVGGEYKCIYCSRDFNKGWKLKIHMVNHSGKAPYICQYCKEDFLYPGKIVEHLKREHDIYFACKDCGLGFRTLIEQETHICKLFDCKDCSVSFCTGKELLNHTVSHKIKSEHLVSEKNSSQTHHGSMKFSENEITSLSNFDMSPSLRATNKAKTLTYTFLENKSVPCQKENAASDVELEKEKILCAKSKTPHCTQDENKQVPCKKSTQSEIETDFSKEKVLLNTPLESKKVSKEINISTPCIPVESESTLCHGNKTPPHTQVESIHVLHKNDETPPYPKGENKNVPLNPSEIVQISTSEEDIEDDSSSKIVAKKLNSTHHRSIVNVKLKLTKGALSEENVLSKNVSEFSTPENGIGVDNCVCVPAVNQKSVVNVPSNSSLSTEEICVKVCKFKLAKPSLVSSRRRFINILKKNPCNTKVNKEQTPPRDNHDEVSLESWLTSEGSCVTSDFVFGLEKKGSDRCFNSQHKISKIEKEEYDMTFEDLCQF